MECQQFQEEKINETKKNHLFLKIFIFLGTMVLAFESLLGVLGSNILDEKLTPKGIENDQIVYGMSLPAGWSIISLPVMPNNVIVSSVGIAMIDDSDPNTKAGPLVTTGNYCKATVSAENHYNR